MNNNFNKIESTEALSDLWEIKNKINNPDTTWWELTSIRDDLEKSIREQALIDWLSDLFVDTMIAYLNWGEYMEEDEKESKKLKEMKLMLSLTQSRINREEPSDIKNMRKELESIGVELSNTARMQSWDFEVIYEQLLTTMKIDMSSRWITDFEKYIKSVWKLYSWLMQALLDNSSEIFSDYNNLKLLWVDLTQWWKVDKSQAMRYFDYAVNWFNSSKNEVEKLTYVIMLFISNN